MKKISIILGIAAVALLSCTNEVEQMMQQETLPEVSFTEGVSTKTIDGHFSQGQQISVFAIDKDGELKSFGNHTDNSKYQYNGSKFFKAQKVCLMTKKQN